MENKKMKHLAKTLAKDMIRRDMKKWPPDCFGLAYQPIQNIPTRDFPHLVVCKVHLPIF